MVKRIYIDASKVIEPTFQDMKEAGCKKDKIGTCPMTSNCIPNDENGCQFCRKVKETWVIKEKILSIISESELKQLDYYELDDGDAVKQIIVSRFEELGYLQGDVLLSFVKQYCSFSNDNYAISVADEGKGTVDGRHRVKIAQNMGIKIPVHWE